MKVDMMTEQILGHYLKHKKTLLNEFDHQASLIDSSLVEQYGREFASRLKTDAHQEYEKLIPEIPFIPGIRGRPLNTFLLVTAQELAVYKAMKKHGKPANEAWELCHTAIRLITAEIPKWKRWLLKKLMFSPLVKAIVKKRAEKQEKAFLGDFEIEYLIGNGNDFDFGVNYHQCSNLNFAKKHGGEEFAPYICMSDIALSDALGWGLTRSQTLADGCDHCDFRFRKGEPTQITSKTPEVQATVEKLHKGEAHK
jgi:hypothetical protein